MNNQLPGIVPEIVGESKPFWDATAKGQLLLPRCDACQTVIWYPRAWCGTCGGGEISWFEASGRATLYTFSVTRRGRLAAFTDAVPYVLAYVTLEEGPTIMTNVIDCDPEAVEIGAALQVVFEPTEGGVSLPRFRPVPGGDEANDTGRA